MRRDAQRRSARSAAKSEKIVDFLDEAAFGRVACKQQQYVAVTRERERSPQTVDRVRRLDQRAARLVGDRAEPAIGRAREHGVGDESLHTGLDQRAETSRHRLAAERPPRRFKSEKYRGEHGRQIAESAARRNAAPDIQAGAPPFGRRPLRRDAPSATIAPMSPGPFPLELLTTEQMARADRLTIDAGVPGMELMEQAAAAVTRVTAQILQRTSGRRIVVLCGPGNNGGDGYVVARLLRAQRYKVRVASLVPPDQLRGDAAKAAAGWTCGVTPAAECDFTGVDLVVDALFGTGLARDLDADAISLVRRLNQWRRVTRQNVVSVDIPSGVDGTTGAIRGAAVEADATVTFFRVKTGHLLLPGRTCCGRLTCAHIGIRSTTLQSLNVKTYVNAPELWRSELPAPQIDGHKYSRGHALVVSGGASFTGAARLSAAAALRAGAGLVTLASPQDALAVNASALTSVMVRPADGAAGLAAVLTDERKNSVAIGPGLGVSEESCRQVETALQPQAYRRAAVLDADALSSFETDPFRLWRATRAAPGPVVMTPHAGEFARLFAEADGDAAHRCKLEKSRVAARASGATLLYKGPDTVVAAPDGRASILPWATPWLATAGSGDVLTGIIAGLLAQRMEAFAAASCAAWMHARAAELFGPGLIADDIIATLPMVWRELHKQ